MSAASETKIFGIKLGVDPKWVVGGLILIAAAVLFFNSRSSDSDSGAGTAANTGFHPLPNAAVTAGRSRRLNRRVRPNASNDRGVLRIKPVDATRGDIDPTLRLDLLARLQTVPEAKVTRSLFELQAAEPSLEKIKELNVKVTPAPIVTAPPPPQAVAPMMPQVNIPLKFYGFVKPAGRSSVNRGLFLEGDNVVVATEGDMVDHRYLVVELTAASARLSDTQLKQEQTLPLTPATNVP